MRVIEFCITNETIRFKTMLERRYTQITRRYTQITRRYTQITRIYSQIKSFICGNLRLICENLRSICCAKSNRIVLLIIAINFAFCPFLYSVDNDFEDKRSTHFIVYYKDGVDTDFIDDIIESAESYYEEIAKNLGYHRYNFWLWDERAKIYIFNDKDSYQKETKQPEWSGGCALYQEKKLWTYPHAAGFFDSILPHELGHIVFREFVGFANNIPLWFEEGVASYQEKSKRYAAKSLVKDFITKKRIFTMPELSSIRSVQDIANNEVAEVFYAEAVSIVYFLINKFDDYRFALLCRSLREGIDFDKALDKSYFSIKDTQDLYKQWLRYINE